MRVLKALPAVIASCFAIFWSVPAEACSSGAWVAVDFRGGPFPKQFEARVLSDFRAGLANENIDICSSQAPGSGAPLATVRVSAEAGTTVSVSVDVRDAVTEKRVGRDIDLSQVPEDGRAFAVALAADELLRASWAELVLRRRSLPKRAAPRVVHAALESVLEVQSPEARPRLGLRGAVERYSQGLTLYGAQLFVRARPTPWLGFEGHAGASLGAEVAAVHGGITSSAWSLGLAVVGPIWRQPSSFTLSWFAGVEAAWLKFRGRAQPAAREFDWTGIAIPAQVGADLGLHLVGPLWLDARAGAGLPIRALEAMDQEHVGASTRAVAVLFGLGLGVAL